VILRWRDANGRPHDWAITTLANSGKEGRKLNIDNIYMAAQEVRKIREKHPDYKASVKSALKETFPARAMQPAPTSTTEKNSVPSTRQNFPAKDDVPQREFSYPRQIYHKEL
jgi:hypothetical protein